MATGRHTAAVGVLVAVLGLVLSPVAAPSAHAATWSGTGVTARTEYAARLVEGVNARRQAHGLRPLRHHVCVDGFAEDWARTLDRNDWFRHADMGRLMSRCGATYASENLAGWSAGVPPRDIVAAWMRSSGHRANILSPKARRFGVAVVWDSSRRSFHAVLDLARF